MMKLIGRIMVILAVAAMIAGIFYLVTRDNGVQSTDRPFRQEGVNQQGGPPDGFEGRGDRRGRDGTGLLESFGSLVSTFVPIAIITVIVVFIDKLLIDRRRSKKISASADNSP